MRKNVFVILVLLFFIGTLFLMYQKFGPSKIEGDYTQDMVSCLQEWERRDLQPGDDYVVGKVLIYYKGVEQPREIDVAPQTELDVVCKMFEDSRVEFAEPIFYSQ